MDTNWIIDYLKGKQPIVRLLNELTLEGIGISIITLAELYQGLHGSNDPKGDEVSLNAFLDDTDVVPIDDVVCRIFAAERHRLRVAGMPIENFDLMIASTAIRHDLTLATNNRRHFERVRNLRIISV